MDNFIPGTSDDAASAQKAKLIRNILIISIISIVIFGGIFLYFKFRKTATEGETGSLFPTGKDIVGIITDTIKGEEPTQETVLSDTARLIELYKGPVGGYTILQNSRTARVFDRAKGLIFDINLNTGELKAVSDQPILKVYDATFIGEKSMITRSLETDNLIKSSLYEFTSDETSGMLTQSNVPSFLSDDILELAKSQNNQYVVFVMKDVRGSNIDLYNTDSKRLTRLISLPLSEWIPSVSNEGDVFISGKASKYADSGTYKISKGILDVVVPAKTAQTTSISNKGLVALSVSIYNNELISSLSNTDPNAPVDYMSDKKNPGINTITEKCSWNKLDTIIFCGIPKEFGKNTPDDWYLGKTSYSDTMWQFNTKTGESSLLIDPENEKTKIDAVSLTPNGNILFFRNKNDEHLWGYRLDEDIDVEKIEAELTSTTTPEIQNVETNINKPETE